MKKFKLLLLLLVMSVTFSACGTSKDTGDDTEIEEEEEKEEKTKKKDEKKEEPEEVTEGKEEVKDSDLGDSKGNREIEDNRYPIDGIRAYITGPSEGFAYFSPHVPYTKEDCERIGIDYDQLESYMSILGEELLVVQEDYSSAVSPVSFKIIVKPGDAKFDMDKMNLADQEGFAKGIIMGFGASDYDWYETDFAKYIVFDAVVNCEETRYVTQKNGYMIYIAAEQEGGVSRSNAAILAAMVDSFNFDKKYDASGTALTGDVTVSDWDDEDTPLEEYGKSEEWSSIVEATRIVAGEQGLEFDAFIEDNVMTYKYTYKDGTLGNLDASSRASMKETLDEEMEKSRSQVEEYVATMNDELGMDDIVLVFCYEYEGIEITRAEFSE